MSQQRYIVVARKDNQSRTANRPNMPGIPMQILVDRRVNGMDPAELPNVLPVTGGNSVAQPSSVTDPPPILATHPPVVKWSVFAFGARERRRPRGASKAGGDMGLRFDNSRIGPQGTTQRDASNADVPGQDRLDLARAKLLAGETSLDRKRLCSDLNRNLAQPFDETYGPEMRNVEFVATLSEG